MTEEQQETPPPKGLVFRDYTDFAASTTDLVLPYNGKPYRIPPVGIKTASILHGVSIGDADTPKDWTGEEFYRRLLGSAYDEMLEDDVPVPFVQRAATTQWTDVVRGRASALAMWELGDDPEAWAAVMAAPEESPAPSKSAGRSAARASGARSASRSSSSTSRGAKSSSTNKPPAARRGRTSSAAGSSSKATSKPS